MPDNFGMPTREEQHEDCRQWRDWLREAGYEVYINWTEDKYFDREWHVYGHDSDGAAVQVATFDIDGCGASWHGDDALWLKVIGSHVGVTR